MTMVGGFVIVHKPHIGEPNNAAPIPMIASSVPAIAAAFPPQLTHKSHNINATNGPIIRPAPTISCHIIPLPPSVGSLRGSTEPRNQARRHRLLVAGAVPLTGLWAVRVRRPSPTEIRLSVARQSNRKTSKRMCETESALIPQLPGPVLIPARALVLPYRQPAVVRGLGGSNASESATKRQPLTG